MRIIFPTGSDGRSLEEDSVVDVSDEAVRFVSSGALSAEEVEDGGCQLHVFTVLYELTEMRKT